ncbi:hypothetical protein GGR54DRAFT_654961 [Hypoxylon sp. NC1633]|nr:hypothetical protein GGR54DRAFT_654961 [Hypoxylon sp. NC1633]
MADYGFDTSLPLKTDEEEEAAITIMDNNRYAPWGSSGYATYPMGVSERTSLALEESENNSHFHIQNAQHSALHIELNWTPTLYPPPSQSPLPRHSTLLPRQNQQELFEPQHILYSAPGQQNTTYDKNYSHEVPTPPVLAPEFTSAIAEPDIRRSKGGTTSTLPALPASTGLSGINRCALQPPLSQVDPTRSRVHYETDPSSEDYDGEYEAMVRQCPENERPSDQGGSPVYRVASPQLEGEARWTPPGSFNPRGYTPSTPCDEVNHQSTKFHAPVEASDVMNRKATPQHKRGPEKPSQADIHSYSSRDAIAVVSRETQAVENSPALQSLRQASEEHHKIEAANSQLLQNERSVSPHERGNQQSNPTQDLQTGTRRPRITIDGDCFMHLRRSDSLFDALFTANGRTGDMSPILHVKGNMHIRTTKRKHRDERNDNSEKPMDHSAGGSSNSSTYSSSAHEDNEDDNPLTKRRALSINAS